MVRLPTMELKIRQLAQHTALKLSALASCSRSDNLGTRLLGWFIKTKRMKYTGIITTAFIAMFFAYIVISLIAVGRWMYSLIFIPVIPFLVMAFEQEINELKK